MTMAAGRHQQFEEKSHERDREVDDLLDEWVREDPDQIHLERGIRREAGSQQRLEQEGAVQRLALLQHRLLVGERVEAPAMCNTLFSHISLVCGRARNKRKRR